MSLPRDFKGIWIPKELWLDHRLTFFEKCMFAEIDSLDGPDNCYADNEHFEKMFQVRPRTVTECISKLRNLGLIEQVGFDGRKRFLKSNLKTIYAKFEGADPSQSARQTRANPLPSSRGESIEREIPYKIPKEKEEESNAMADAIALSNEFYSSIKRVNQENYTKPYNPKWEKTFELMIRLDKHDPNIIRTVMNWAVEHEFWRSNVLSADKLRDKFLQLKIQMESTWKTKNSKSERKPIIEPAKSPQNTPADPDFVKRLFPNCD